MELPCPLGTTHRIPQEIFPRKPYNKSFTDQTCSVKMAGNWPRSFFCEFMDLDSVSDHKHAKKELGQYPTILTEQAWSITHTYCYYTFLLLLYFLTVTTPSFCFYTLLLIHLLTATFTPSYCHYTFLLLPLHFLLLLHLSLLLHLALLLHLSLTIHLFTVTRPSYCYFTFLL